jgi:signal transduction histidine kinase
MFDFFQNHTRRLLWVVFFFVFLISITLIANNYRQQITLIEERELSRLEGIAVTLAMMVDGDAHDDLIHNYGMDEIKANNQDSAYYQIHDLLKRAQEAHDIKSTIYTMVYEPGIDKFCFGVSSAERPFWKHAYRDYPPDMLSNYTTGGRLSMYTDSNGVWLSAFHPIRNSLGQPVGILQIDEAFEEFIAEANEAAFKNSVISALAAAFIMLVLFYILNTILRQQEKLAEDKEELEVLRKELLANVSHDLRTPLASIHGYIETVLLIDDLDNDRRNRYLETALKSTVKLKALIDELFELSRLESKDRKPEIETFSLAELAADVISGFRIAATQKDVLFEEVMSPDLPAVQADIALIDRVLHNLLSNALRYTDPGGKITLQITELPEVLQVEIKDTGIGIPQDQLDTVFERFNTGTAGLRKGTGLGLAIVKSILDAHQASYQIQSEQGAGTRFSFQLKKAR